MTPALFAEEVLVSLSLPVTAENVAALIAFQAQEGGHEQNSAWHNPLNTMRDAPGAVDAGLKVKGIKAYPSWETGIAATAETIAQPNMRGIYAALARSAPAAETLRAVSASPWGWYKYVDHARVSLPYHAAEALLASPAALASFGGRAYRAAGAPSSWPSFFSWFHLPASAFPGLPGWTALFVVGSTAVLGSQLLGPRHGRAGAAAGALAGLGAWLFASRALGGSARGPRA